MTEPEMAEAQVANHDQFIANAKDFRHQLKNAGFTREEVTSMLGAFVLANYQQRFATEYPPELFEMMTKNSLLTDRALSEEEG